MRHSSGLRVRMSPSQTSVATCYKRFTLRALERLHHLIQQLRPLDRQVMVLYLEQLDAAVTGISAVNVATKVRRIKQILIQRFHAEEGHGHQL